MLAERFSYETRVREGREKWRVWGRFSSSAVAVAGQRAALSSEEASKQILKRSQTTE